MKRGFRCALCAGIVVSLLAWPAALAAAKIKSKSFGRVNQERCSLTVDSAGQAHVVYQDGSYHFCHARLAGGRWQHTVVDAQADCGWGNSLASGADGTLHASYSGFRGLGYQKLSYARHSNGTWQITDLGVEGWASCLKLDAAGRPRILFEGPAGLRYALWDGTQWRFEETGLWSGPYRPDFALDAADNAHVVYSRNGAGLYYATNRSGTWESVLLEAGNAMPAGIAVDSRGRIHVACATGPTAKYWLYAADKWTSEELWEPADLAGAHLDQLALAVGPDDQPQVLIGASFGGVLEVAIYAFHNGRVWAGWALDYKNLGYCPSLAVGPTGTVYGVYCSALSKNAAKARWVAIDRPDLRAQLREVAVAGAPGEWTVTGWLRVDNVGPVKTAKTIALLLVSDDAELDPSDELLPVALKVKALAPGAGLDLEIGFRYTTALAGRHLIAVVDAELLNPDRNALDNVVAVELGP